MANEKPVSKTKLLEDIKRNHKAAWEATSKQREREREDLRFQVGENQWDEAAKTVRKGRPMLSISLLAQPLQLIRNQAATAHLGVEVHPVSESAEKEIAEVKQGLYRRIERDSNAAGARLWGLDRAMKCGRGWYRVSTQWDEDGDDPFDQEIVIQRILHQENVYIDPAAQEADFSDARWGMVTAWMPVDAFKEEFGDKVKVPVTDEEFQAWDEDEPSWVMENKDEKAVLVAEYWYKVHDRKEVETKGRKRVMDRVSVKWCKCTGREILDEQDWNGRYIPLIPVLGCELQSFDGEHRWEGLVRPARDGQRFANYCASSIAEAIALEPKAPFIGYTGQFEGHPEWDEANTRNLPYLEANPVVDAASGQVLPLPQRAQVDGSRMVLAMQGFQQAKELVQSATAMPEPSLGEMPSRSDARSGRAILALQLQSDAGTSHYLQSMADVSMMYEARVVLDLMPAVYDRPGRVTEILGLEDNPKTVMLGRPFIPGQDGRPQAVPEPAPPGPGLAPPQLPPEAKIYDLSKGKYTVSVNVGKAFQTRLQEGQAKTGAILERSPQLLPIIGDIFFKYDDSPGATEIGKRLERMREKQFPGLGDDDEEGGMSIEQAMSQLQAQEQQMQQMGQQMQAMQQALETDRAKQEATVTKTQMDNQSRETIARLESTTRLMLEALKLKGQAEEGELRREHDAIEGEMDRVQEDRSEEFGAARDITLERMKEADAERMASRQEAGAERSEQFGAARDMALEKLRQAKPQTNKQTNDLTNRRSGRDNR